MTNGVKSKELKRYWIVMIYTEGFESVMLMYGTREDLWGYIGNSFKYSVNYRYRSASDEDVAMAKKLGIKAYIC